MQSSVEANVEALAGVIERSRLVEAGIFRAASVNDRLEELQLGLLVPQSGFTQFLAYEAWLQNLDLRLDRWWKTTDVR
jgi:hypothetical protein